MAEAQTEHNEPGKTTILASLFAFNLAGVKLQDKNATILLALAFSAAGIAMLHWDRGSALSCLYQLCHTILQFSGGACNEDSILSHAQTAG